MDQTWNLVHLDSGLPTCADLKALRIDRLVAVIEHNLMSTWIVNALREFNTRMCLEVVAEDAMHRNTWVASSMSFLSILAEVGSSVTTHSPVHIGQF